MEQRRERFGCICWVSDPSLASQKRSEHHCIVLGDKEAELPSRNASYFTAESCQAARMEVLDQRNGALELILLTPGASRNIECRDSQVRNLPLGVKNKGMEGGVEKASSQKTLCQVHKDCGGQTQTVFCRRDGRTYQKCLDS